MNKQKQYVKSDPLVLLRDFTMKKKEVKLSKDNKYLSFESEKFEVTTQTNWVNSKKEKYNLVSLWFYIQNHGDRKYIQLVQNHDLKDKLVNIPHVEQEEVLQYFSGEIDTSEKIIKEDVLLEKRKNESLNLTEGRKKFKKEGEINQLDGGMDEAQQKQIAHKEDCAKLCEWAHRYERPINSKTRVLRVTGKSLKEIVEIYQRFTPGNVTLKNIKKLLAHGHYLEEDKVSQNEAGIQAFEDLSEKVLIQKKIGDENMTFEFMDNTLNFKEKRGWERVVAVFLEGSQYQFKNWPGANNNQAQILQKYRGIFLRYSDQWNVKHIEISRNQRHLDQTVSNQIWEEIESFLQKNRNF